VSEVRLPGIVRAAGARRQVTPLFEFDAGLPVISEDHNLAEPCDGRDVGSKCLFADQGRIVFLYRPRLMTLDNDLIGDLHHAQVDSKQPSGVRVDESARRVEDEDDRADIIADDYQLRSDIEMFEELSGKTIHSEIVPPSLSKDIELTDIQR
jgi:hypothetical protein